MDILGYVVTFSGQLYFRKSYFLTVSTSSEQSLRQSNYFDTTVTSQSSYFFRAVRFFDLLIFQNSHFFTAAVCSEQLLFQSETSFEWLLLKDKQFFPTVLVMRSFRGTLIIPMRDLQPSILSMVLYVFLRLKLTSIQFFSVFQNTSYCETNFLSKRPHFQSSINYIQMRVATPLKQVPFRNFFFQNTQLSGACNSF